MIRSFQAADINSIIDIWLEASITAHHFMEKEFWISKKEEMKEIYIPNSETYVFENEDGICGFFSLYKHTLAAIFVLPRYQGMGIGRELIQKAKELRDEINLTVYKENPKSVNFYKKVGFRIIKEQIDDNTGHPEFLMEWTKRKKEGIR